MKLEIWKLTFLYIHKKVRVKKANEALAVFWKSSWLSRDHCEEKGQGEEPALPWARAGQSRAPLHAACQGPEEYSHTGPRAPSACWNLHSHRHPEVLGKNTGVGCHFLLQCMKVKSESQVAQSCLTLCDPVDCSLPGSSIYGIFQARVLEWVAIAFSGILN